MWNELLTKILISPNSTGRFAESAPDPSSCLSKKQMNTLCSEALARVPRRRAGVTAGMFWAIVDATTRIKIIIFRSISVRFSELKSSFGNFRKNIRSRKFTNDENQFLTKTSKYNLLVYNLQLSLKGASEQRTYQFEVVPTSKNSSDR